MSYLFITISDFVIKYLQNRCHLPLILKLSGYKHCVQAHRWAPGLPLAGVPGSQGRCWAHVAELRRAVPTLPVRLQAPAKGLLTTHPIPEMMLMWHEAVSYSVICLLSISSLNCSASRVMSTHRTGERSPLPLGHSETKVWDPAPLYILYLDAK